MSDPEQDIARWHARGEHDACDPMQCDEVDYVDPADETWTLTTPTEEPTMTAATTTTRPVLISATVDPADLDAFLAVDPDLLGSLDARLDEVYADNGDPLTTLRAVGVATDPARTLAEVLAAHRTSWDSWGWHCSCDRVDHRLTDLPVAEGVNPGKAAEARAAADAHVAEAILAALAPASARA